MEQEHKSSNLPLISVEEAIGWNQKLETCFRARTPWAVEHKARTEILVERASIIARRVRERADEFLDALTIMVGSRGSLAVEFMEAFAPTPQRQLEIQRNFELHNNAETRATLCTLLKALTEIPHTWNEIEFRRFLRGSGEEGSKRVKFPGRAIFRSSSGWEISQVDVICLHLVGDNSHYANSLRQWESSGKLQPNCNEDDADEFRLVDIEKPKTDECPAPKPFNIEFINFLCDNLAHRENQ